MNKKFRVDPDVQQLSNLVLAPPPPHLYQDHHHHNPIRDNTTLYKQCVKIRLDSQNQTAGSWPAS